MWFWDWLGNTIWTILFAIWYIFLFVIWLSIVVLIINWIIKMISKLLSLIPDNIATYLGKFITITLIVLSAKFGPVLWDYVTSLLK